MREICFASGESRFLASLGMTKIIRNDKEKAVNDKEHRSDKQDRNDEDQLIFTTT